MMWNKRCWKHDCDLFVLTDPSFSRCYARPRQFIRDCPICRKEALDKIRTEKRRARYVPTHNTGTIKKIITEEWFDWPTRGPRQYNP